MASTNQQTSVEPPEWELSKENFQPLKAGRKPGGLKLRSPEVDKRPLEEQRMEHLQAIENYSGDDPLTVWLSYIKWTQLAYSAGGHKAELLPILERCTRELQGMSRYRDDLRYLRLWIQYADCLPDPGDVFSFLKQKNIGQGHALFHIAHATFLELRGAYSAADNAYQQGINRRAEPLERIRSKFHEFQHRMTRRIHRKAQEQAAISAEPPVHPERKSLAAVGGRPGRSAGLASQKRKAVATPGKSNASSGGGLSIFVDDEFVAGGAPVSSAPAAFGGHGPSASATSTTWTQLPSFETSRKENTQKASSWAGQRIKQKPALSAPPAPALDIPVDPEFAANEIEGKKAREAAAIQGTLRQRLDRGHLDEQLVHDPLQLHRHEQPNVAPQPRQQPTSRESREHILACDEASLTDTVGVDVSFEERRSRHWVSVNNFAPPVIQQQAQHAPGQIAQQVDDVVDMHATPFNNQNNLEMAQANKDLVREQAVIAGHDVTLSTSNAFQAANAICTRDSGMRCASSGEVSSLDPTVTLATKKAFAAINTAFQQQPHARAIAMTGGAEPTVTINTRAAFDALNAAFGSAAPQLYGDTVGTEGHTSPTIIVSKDIAADAPERSGGFTVRDDTVLINRGQRNSGEYEGAEKEVETSLLQRNSAGGFGASSDGFSIREDTVFINHRHSGMVADDGDAEDGLLIREDTVFIEKELMEGETAPLGLRNRWARAGHDAEDSTAEVGDKNRGASKWGFAPGVEDTIRLGPSLIENRAPQTMDETAPLGFPAPARPVSTRLTGDMQALQLGLEGQVTSPSIDHAQTTRRHCGRRCEAENDENAAPEGLFVTKTEPRWPTDPSIAPLVLQPLRGAALIERGVELGQNEEAEKNLTISDAESDEDKLSGDDFHVASSAAASPRELRAVDPFSTEFQSCMVNALDPPVSSWSHVERMSAIEWEARKAALKSAKADEANTVSVGSRSLTVLRCIGSGAYATVYQAIEEDKKAAGADIALKMESPPCPWEFYLCCVVGGRVPVEARSRFVLPTALALGDESSMLIMPRSRFGSLQDFLNAHLAKGAQVAEPVVMRLSAELLSLVGHLHGARILHNDIKPDNLLMMVSPGTDENDPPRLGLQLIDFGRGVDLHLLPEKTVLAGDSGTDSFRCVEMREGGHWLWQADAYAVAAVIHCLLFGKYMEVERVVQLEGEGPSRLRIKAALRRYWQTEVWEEIFETLLNWDSLDTEAPPPCSRLAMRLESCLQGGVGGRSLHQTNLELAKAAEMLRQMEV